MIPGEISPTEVLEAPIPTPDTKDLYRMHQDGMYRYGIIAAIMNQNNEILMLEHCASDKTEGGMWGPLGETSLVHLGLNKEIALEPTTTTLRRGIQEELLVDIAQFGVQTYRDKPFFDTTWPVGLAYPGQIGAARSPIVVVGEELEAAIMQAPASDEISDKQFMDINDALDFANDAELADEPSVRPGAQQWLSLAADHLHMVRGRQLIDLPLEDWQMSGQPSIDAILKNIWQ